MRLINQFNPNQESISKIQITFPEKVSLGELNLKYYSFLTALKNKIDYEKDNAYEKQRISILDDIQWKTSILEEAQKQLTLLKEKLQISQKWFEKYTSLNPEEIVTYEYEVDRSKSELISTKQEEQSLKKELASIRMQIIENKNRLNQLQVEQRENERQLRQDLEQEITNLVLEFNKQQDLIRKASDALEISIRSYTINKQRFLIGKTDVNSVTLSSNRRKEAQRNYINALSNYWKCYYSIRRLTLFDFEKNKSLSFLFDLLVE